MFKFLFAFMALGACGARAAAAECSSFASYRELVQCAETNSPEVQDAQLEWNLASARVEAAGQFKNPEFSAETFQGEVAGDKRGETDLSLGIPIELGGKISSRTAAARAGAGVTEARLFEARAKVRAETVIKLHRLRQALHEEQLADEAIRTFSKLVEQFAKRPGLSPEQQISASVFRLSKGEYDLKKSAVNDELLELDAFFKLKLGVGVETVRKALPPGLQTWPAANSAPSGLSPRLRIQKSELDLALAELEAARGEAWPTLTIGPSMKIIEEGGRKTSLVGMNLSFPLPVFNLNGGGKAAGLAGVELSKSRQSVAVREQELRRETLLKTYRQAVRTLETSISHEEIEKRHVEAEKLFSRGVVPSALVIETHRTSFELEKTRHERELKALEALFDLYAIDGNILEMNL